MFSSILLPPTNALSPLITHALASVIRHFSDLPSEVRTMKLILFLLSCCAVKNALTLENVILEALKVGDQKHERIYIEDDREIHYDLTRYVEIRIENQRMHELQNGTFADLPNLRLLELKHNAIREIDSEAFRNLSSLMLIDLSRNLLSKIKFGIFNGLPVRGLILTRNHIEVIQAEALDDLPNLVVLDLSHNRINRMSSDWFKNCPKLLDINLESNLLTQIPEMSFQNLRIDESEYYYSNRYPTINLSNNRIAALAPNAFSGLEEIFKLRLDRNQLSCIAATAFEDVYKVHHLNFSVNLIQCVDGAVLEDLKRTTVLEMVSNPLKAKCKDGLEEWAKEKLVRLKT